MKDVAGEEIQINDCVFYGAKAGSKGSRGQCKVGRVTKIEGRYATVTGSYTRMESCSLIKCTEKFADMYESGEIFKI
ncbi:MAG: hypothetical protein [Caudoviricetes sp.]|nr:MAG: hypothetical protein [Caudoviricetes sp.]